jgi:hypothetical protein
MDGLQLLPSEQGPSFERPGGIQALGEKPNDLGADVFLEAHNSHASSISALISR